jgi:3'(2'), 5'-bisphosphate nucleotidase
LPRFLYNISRNKKILNKNKEYMVENIDIHKINSIAKKAGDEIMKIYKQAFDVAYKADNSPLTKADIRSNEIITKTLKELYPEIPILSEENKEVPYNIRKSWEYFWLIDPLDGTKEFVKKNGSDICPCIKFTLLCPKRPRCL